MDYIFSLSEVCGKFFYSISEVLNVSILMYNKNLWKEKLDSSMYIFQFMFLEGIFAWQL